MKIKFVTVVAVIFTLMVSPALAAIITFEEIDPGAGPSDPRPKSNAVASEFDIAAGALGMLNLIDFESVAPTFATTVNPLPGVTMNFFNSSLVNRTIQGNDFNASSGYNTTLGGSNWALIAEADAANPTGVEFVFDNPIQAWGAFFTGAGSSPGVLAVTFNDGSFQSLTVTGDPRGGVEFFGFTDAGKFIQSVTFSVSPPPDSNDAVGIDDVRFVFSQVQAVPEPASIVLMLMGLVVLRGAVYKKGRSLP